MTRLSKDRPHWCAPFLEALERIGTVQGACEQVGITAQAAYHYRSRHPEFTEEWQQALTRHKSKSG